jgi:hypothetical protein
MIHSVTHLALCYEVNHFKASQSSFIRFRISSIIYCTLSTVKHRQLHCSSDVGDDGHAVDANERLCREQCQDGVNQMCRERILTLEGLAAADRVLVARHTTEDGDRRAARADRDAQRRDVDVEKALEDALGPRVDVARVLDVLAALRTGSGRRARRRGRRRRPGPLGVDDDGHAVDADEVG